MPRVPDHRRIRLQHFPVRRASSPIDVHVAALAALRSGGIVSFESRNPAFREWERWTPEATRGERVTSVGRLREWHDVTDVREGRVVFDAHNVFPDGEDRVYA